MPTIPLPAALSMQSRRVLVTGAASGIGRATALALAQLGATVVITDRASLDETRDAIRATGGVCMPTRGDLTEDAFLAAFFATERIHAIALRRRAGWSPMA